MRPPICVRSMVEDGNSKQDYHSEDVLLNVYGFFAVGHLAVGQFAARKNVSFG